MSSRRKRTDLWIALIVIGGVIVLVLALSGTFMRGTGSAVIHGDRIGLVEVVGPIYDARDWVKDLDRFRNNKSVKAIVLRLDSPGGAIAASQELYEAVKRAREEKPVIASMGNVAASGAYYAALGADTIVANPGTTTGSIGVIMQLLLVDELFDKIGLDNQVVKSGQYKDAGNPTRQLTEGELEYFQNYIDNAYDQFVNAVAEERHLDSAAVAQVSDGRVFTGTRAQELGLVDVLGDQYLAVRLAGELTGLGSEPNVVRPPRDPELDWIDLLLSKTMGATKERLNTNGIFQYMWKAELTK